MASYTVKLTPSLVNFSTEGGLDTTVVNGVSLQRTVNMLNVENSGLKVVGNVADGGSFDDAIQALGDLEFLA